MSGRSLDLEGDQERRPDFECLGGALVVEIKSLEGDPSTRLSNVIASAKQSDNWPQFFGKWPVESILKNLPKNERELLQRNLLDRLARAIVTHFKKADSQIANYCANRAAVHLRLLVLINEDFVEYDPSIVTFIAQRELRKKNEKGYSRYSNIDAVLYLTERHATTVNGRVTFPITIIHSSEIAAIPRELIRRVTSRWAKWSAGMEALDMSLGLSEFISIDENLKQMRRQDVWERDYRHARYMRSWSDEAVIGLWDFTAVMSLLAFGADSPIKLPEEGVAKLSETTSHLMKEFAFRGIALDKIKPTRQRIQAAIENVPFGAIAQEWLNLQFNHI